MQLILKPVSDERLQEIIVTDTRFAIGRNEGFFKDYHRSIVQKLSRRHARIFERDGRVFIADLNSSNGTTVNGQSVEGEPSQLCLNDEVEFGGLRYRVEHLVGVDAGTLHSEPAVEARIVLNPVRTDTELAPLVISKFPFLVGRHGSAFAQYQQSIPEQLSQISKKHAHFFLHHGAVHIEDLGSTNGTLVCDQRLSEHSRELINHDTVAFGGDYFVYEVQTFVGKETIAEADSRIERLAEGTIFVDDATNFFEIYMGAGAKDVAGEEEGDIKATSIKDSGSGARGTRVGRKLRFLSSLRSSLRSGEPIDKRLRWTITLAIVALSIGLAGYWYIAWPVQQTARLLQDQQFLAAATRANEYLQRLPNDQRLQDLATEAALKIFVPEWQMAMEIGDSTRASQILTQALEMGSANPKDDELIGVLELATKIGAVDVKVNGRQMSIDALTGDESVAALIAEWDSHQTENARALSRIELHVDGFNSYQAGFYRRLRVLREQEKAALPLLALRTNIAAALADRNTAQLRQLVKKFSDAHPDVQGLDRLQEDLRRYEAVRQDIDEKRWVSAYDRLNESVFHTAPFARHAAHMNSSILPDRATRAAYMEAANLWNEGNALDSFEVLGELEGLRWGEDATAILRRNRSLLNELVDLAANRNAADFEDRLFTLYGQLDPEQDDFLRRALQPDIQEHRQSALARAADRLQQAERAWNAYDESGRLRSMHRLEEQVSAEYRDLAGLLTRAYQFLRESAGIYQQLDTTPPDTWSTLNADVVQEIKLQTRAIGDLLVIERDVQEAKLDLLPSLSGN